MNQPTPTEIVWDELQHMAPDVAEGVLLHCGPLMQLPETPDLTQEPETLRRLMARLLRGRNDTTGEVDSDVVDWDDIADRWLRKFEPTYLPEAGADCP